MFSYKIYEICKNTFFYWTSLLWWLLLAVNSVIQWRQTLKVCPAKKRNNRTWILRLVFLGNKCFPNIHCWQYPILVTLHEKARSSRPEVSCEKGVFENFANQRCFPSEKLKAEAVVRMCSGKKVFLEILLNSQENTCAKVSFLQP